MTQKQIDTLVAYVREGHPTLLFHDPLPMVNPSLAPEVPKQAPGGPFGGGQPPEPKGSLQALFDLLGIDAPGDEIVWNRYNPLLNMPELPYEFVFVGKGSGGADAFNSAEPASSGLQEMVLMFPGLVRPKGSTPVFTPLLRVGGIGGTLPFSEVVQQSFMGISGINPNRRHLPSNMEYTLAARIQGKPADDARPADDPARKDAAKPAAPEVKVILIGDLDLVSEQFFEIRRRKVENLDFDNIPFVLNCVDVLAGDDAYIALRKRRAQHRTLARLEEQTREFIKQSQKEAKQAEDDAKDALDKAQKSLDAKVAKIRDDKELDDRTKEIKLQTVERVENRRLDVEKAAIEDDKRRKVQESKGMMEQSIRAIENRVRVGAILAAPLPALLLAGFIFGRRAGKENQGANPNRLA
jgi:ABC-2 type transport system permease protein